MRHLRGAIKGPRGGPRVGYLEKEDSLVMVSRGEQEELLGVVIIQVEKRLGMFT